MRPQPPLLHGHVLEIDRVEGSGSDKSARARLFSERNYVMPANKQRAGFTFILDATERVELLRVLERELRDTHMEARRTESPDFQDDVHHRENVLQALVDKLRHP